MKIVIMICLILCLAVPAPADQPVQLEGLAFLSLRHCARQLMNASGTLRFRLWMGIPQSETEKAFFAGRRSIWMNGSA